MGYISKTKPVKTTRIGSLLGTKKELQSKQISFQTSLNEMGKAIITTDLDGKIVYCNQLTEKVYQWQEKDIIGENIYDMIIVPPNDRLIEGLVNKLNLQSVWQGKLIVRRKDGSKFVANMNINLTGNSQQTKMNFSSISGDYSARTQTEQFSKKTKLFQDSLEYFTCLVIVLGEDGKINYVNSYGEKLLGQKPENMRGNYILNYLKREDIEKFKNHLRQIVQDGQMVKINELSFADGEENIIYVEVIMQNLLQDENVQGIMLTCTDITKRKKLEEKVRELERINHEKDEFISTVAHDLRAPIANMKMAIQMVKIAPDQQKRERYLEILESECKREIDLINDLLDLQRLESKSNCLAIESINLHQLLPKIVEPFLSRSQEYQQSFELEFAPELPCINSHQNSLERIIAELLNNACKYTGKGEKIIMSVGEERSGKNYLKMEISNESEISPEVLPRVFDKFYRVPHGDRFKRGGTGLGLALVKKLVEELGGNIQVKSSNGWTTFTVKIPVN